MRLHFDLIYLQNDMMDLQTYFNWRNASSMPCVIWDMCYIYLCVLSCVISLPTKLSCVKNKLSEQVLCVRQK